MPLYLLCPEQSSSRAGRVVFRCMQVWALQLHLTVPLVACCLRMFPSFCGVLDLSFPWLISASATWLLLVAAFCFRSYGKAAGGWVGEGWEPPSREAEGHGSSCSHRSTFIYLVIPFGYSLSWSTLGTSWRLVPKRGVSAGLRRWLWSTVLSVCGDTGCLRPSI